MTKLHKMPYPKKGKIRRFIIRLAHLQHLRTMAIARSPEYYAGKSRFVSLQTIKIVWDWA